jgi:hypothetical protein
MNYLDWDKLINCKGRDGRPAFYFKRLASMLELKFLGCLDQICESFGMFFLTSYDGTSCD